MGCLTCSALPTRSNESCCTGCIYVAGGFRNSPLLSLNDPNISKGRLRMIKKLAGLVLMLAISCCPALAKKGKWKVLFDGKSTDAWRGFRQDSFPTKTWKVEGGTLRTIVGSESRDIITR